MFTFFGRKSLNNCCCGRNKRGDSIFFRQILFIIAIGGQEWWQFCFQVLGSFLGGDLRRSCGCYLGKITRCSSSKRCVHFHADFRILQKLISMFIKHMLATYSLFDGSDGTRIHKLFLMNFTKIRAMFFHSDGRRFAACCVGGDQWGGFEFFLGAHWSLDDWFLHDLGFNWFHIFFLFRHWRRNVVTDCKGCWFGGLKRSDFISERFLWGKLLALTITETFFILLLYRNAGTHVVFPSRCFYA